MENIDLGPMRQASHAPAMVVARAPMEEEDHTNEGEEGQLKRMRGGCVPCVSHVRIVRVCILTINSSLMDRAVTLSPFPAAVKHSDRLSGERKRQ